MVAFSGGVESLMCSSLLRAIEPSVLDVIKKAS